MQAGVPGAIFVMRSLLGFVALNPFYALLACGNATNGVLTLA
jgi:hypothetical protein